jgi:Kef-type K+ transport system membrane component KefB/nucleotide-binding universal stress UspA family protein
MLYSLRSPRTTLAGRLGIGPTLALAALIGVAWFLVGPAQAAEPAGSGPSEVLFIAQIVLLILTGRLLGEAMQRIGQPAVMGQLVAGLLLGPSVFGAIFPEAQHALFPKNPAQKGMIDGVAQLGVLMLLLLTGMETDLALAKRVRRAALSVSVTGIVIPFSCGLLVGWFLPDDMLPDANRRLITALFLGTALSISSVKIVAMVVREMNFLRRNVGQVIVASAIIDDTIGWVIIAITFGLAQSGTIELGSVAKSVIGTTLFLGLSLTIGRRVVARLIRWTNDTFVGEVPVISMILVIMGLMALTTHLIGVHSVLGAFVAGILVGESPILTRHIEAELRGLITALFMPVFFGLSGLQADLTILKDPNLLLLTVGLILIASVGKFAGAFIGAEVAGMSRAEGMALAAGMNARGSTEVIVASIGLSMGVLNHDLFTMIVAMAVLTTMAMPPTLRWALARLPMKPEEEARLNREESEAKAFLPNLERLLVTVDSSPTGRFAARLSGLIAGSRGMPTTVLQLAPETATANETVAETEATIREVASVTHLADEEAYRDPGDIDVLARVQTEPTEEAVATESRKGHDLLFVGLEPSFDPTSGAFAEEVARVASSFEGALGIVTGRGAHRRNPLGSRLNILVPVNGTEVSRRAAEVGIALARAADAPITALTVSPTANEQGGRLERPELVRRNEQAILLDIESIAEQYHTPIRTAVRVRGVPQDAILRQARRGNYSLIVIGVSRRPGDELFFGKVAATLLEHAEQSILLVAA